MSDFHVQNLCDIYIIQDKVPAFSPEKARGFIESELGAPINILFKEFQDRPIAAASLGQVRVRFMYTCFTLITCCTLCSLKDNMIKCIYCCNINLDDPHTNMEK